MYRLWSNADRRRGRPSRAFPLTSFMVPATLCLWGLSMLPGCSAEGYRKEADEEVYAELSRLQKDVYGEERSFDVERPLDTLRQTMLAEMKEQTGEEGPAAKGREVGLLDCLEIAAENSRDFQQQKESVFLRVLDLTFEHYLFDSRYFGTIDSTYSRNGGGEGGTNSRSESTTGSTGFNRQLASGGRLLVSFASTLLRRFTGISTGRESSSVLSLSFTQPLLSGAGRKIALEPLTQAERNAIYSLRSFERFRMTFAVRIASEYFRLVQQKAQIQNEIENVKTTTASRDRTKSMADEGRIPKFQLDQAEQDMLRAQDRLIVVREQYESQLDRFKITLGLPTDAPLDVLINEHETTGEAELTPLELGEERALEIALGHRRDFANARDAVEDAQRKVEVAKDALRAGLDFSASVDIGTETNKPLDLDIDYTDYSLGLGLDLPFDRVSERNAYRESLISLEQTKREAERLEDQVKLDIRDALRTLTQTRQTYDIQNLAVKLAEVRVDSTKTLQLYGRVETRDVLESQDALVAARNALDAALADYQVARLELLRDMGMLAVQPEGLKFDDTFEVTDE